jgi:hypothetical protein
MRDPEMVARAGYAAARLEQAWERWRALHGLSGSFDPLATYVGYSHKEPMGQPRVVIGVDAAEAEFFADFLEGHDCAAPSPGGDAGAGTGRPVAGSPAAGFRSDDRADLRPDGRADARPVNGSGRPSVNGMGSPLDSGALYPPVSGPQPVMANGSPRPAETGSAGPRRAGPLGAPVRDEMATVAPAGAAPSGLASVSNGSVAGGGPGGSAAGPRDVPSEPMARLMDETDPHGRSGTERPVSQSQAPVTRAFPAPTPAPVSVPTFTPIGDDGRAGEPISAEPRGGIDPSAGSPPDVIAAELAGWASGELPGQASEQLASWGATDGPGGRALNRSRSAR